MGWREWPYEDSSRAGGRGGRRRSEELDRWKAAEVMGVHGRELRYRRRKVGVGAERGRRQRGLVDRREEPGEKAQWNNGDDDAVEARSRHREDRDACRELRG